MSFLEAIRSGFSNYVTFSGRAVRSEFWYWALFTTLASFVAGIFDVAIFSYNPGVSPFESVFNLVTFLPSLALWARRLHDTDRTAWWLLLVFTIIGFFLLIYWAWKRGTPGPNRFGPDPFTSGDFIPRSTA